MAAPSSSSCEVVDLGLAATSDDAASQIFFSKAGGDDLSWPAAAEIDSKLTKQESLVALCDKHGVPKELKPVSAAVVLGCAAACETPPQGSNALCIYSDALEAVVARLKVERQEEHVSAVAQLTRLKEEHAAKLKEDLAAAGTPEPEGRPST